MCGSYLIWSHTGAVGSTQKVVCGNNPVSSRIVSSIHDIKFCFWEGTCERKKTGKMLFKGKDGFILRKKRFW